MMSAAAVIIGRQGMWICVAAKTGDTETIVIVVNEMQAADADLCGCKNKCDTETNAIVVKKWHAGDVDLCQCKRKRHLNE